MRTMDLDNIKPSLHSPPRSISEPLNQLLDVLQRQRLRRRIVPSERNRTRRHHVMRPPADSLLGQVRPRPLDHPPGEGARLAPRVRELDARLPALAVDEVDDAPQRRDLRVLPEPQAVGEMRPRASTAVASTMVSAAPERANWPRWTRWKSVACPSRAL
uniref:Uncharacterized protein n=1 Tax=Bionectria ochroleuca TaxID=29856 RepID=A0A8H7TNC4_BIOOC